MLYHYLCAGVLRTARFCPILRQRIEVQATDQCDSIRGMRKKAIHYRKPKPKPVVAKPYSYITTRIPHESWADDFVMWPRYHLKWSHVLWTIGVYVAAFGLASQRHENHRDRIDNKIAILAAQLGTPARNAAFARVNELQDKIKIPIEPKFLLPWTSFTTLFGEKEVSD